MMEAQSVYGQRQAQGPFTGEMVAQGTPGQTNAAGVAENFNQGPGANIPNYTAGTAGTLMGAASPYVQNAGNIAANGIAGPNQGLYGTLQNYSTGAKAIAGASAPLSTALNSAAVSGANSLQGFQNTLTSAANKGLSDPTQQIEQNAQTYANAPQVQNSVNATNAAINQTLNESTLPTQNQQEASAGALNSSRSGMAEGMARQNAATTEGLADANIYNNANNTGMAQAGSLYTAGLNTATQAGMFGYNDVANNANTQAQQQIGLNEANTTNQMGAANAGLTQGLNYSNADINAKLNANSQLGNATNMGVNAGTAATTQAGNNFSLGAAAGTLQQQQQQAADTNAYDVWGNNNTYQQGILQQYFGIVGAPLGTSGATTQTAQAPFNPVGMAAGGASAAYGLYKNYKQNQQGQQANYGNAPAGGYAQYGAAQSGLYQPPTGAGGTSANYY
jgi:hypothetical protein